MAEWAYKANKQKRSLTDTRWLAEEQGILMRSGYRKDRNPVPSVHQIEVGHTIHFYYREKKSRIVELGSYRVLAGDEPRFPFAVEGAALVRIAKVPENTELLRVLRAEPKEGAGYKEDPKLHDFTGFRIERIPDVSPPPIDVWQFPMKGTLTRKRVSVPAPEVLLSRITHDAGVMAGKACFRGMRITVGTVLGLLAAGRTEDDVLVEYPYLDKLDLRAALAYAAYRLEESEIPLQAA